MTIKGEKRLALFTAALKKANAKIYSGPTAVDKDRLGHRTYKIAYDIDILECEPDSLLNKWWKEDNIGRNR